MALGEASTLTLHAGRLEARAGGGGYYGTPAQARSDFHVGLTTVLDGWTVHLAFRAVRGDASPYAAGTRRQGWEGGILRYF